MTDHTKLRRKAEAATRREWVDEGWAEAHFGSRSEAEFVAAASPATVIALLDEIDALKAAQAVTEKVLTRIDEAFENYERHGATCEFEGNPMIYAGVLSEIVDLRHAATKEKP